MDTVTNNDMARHASSGVDNAANTMRGGINDAQDKAKDASATLGNKAGELGQTARQAFDSGADQVKRGIGSLKDKAQNAAGSVGFSSDTVITFTKEHPVKALMMAAASGALVWTLIKRTRN